MSNAATEHREAGANLAVRPRNKLLAVAINCIVPGLGLAYLGHWRWAAINFFVVLTVLLACVWWSEPILMEHIHWVMMVLVVGSGSVARSVAEIDVAS